MSWLKEVIGTEKAIIAMCHLDPLPGDPSYGPGSTMEQVIENARKDLLALQNGGVDAVMFSNEFSLPYLTQVETVTVAAMARIIGELKSDIKIPFGVNVLWDAERSLDLAAATGAKFVREIFTGVYASDFGLWNTNIGKTIRHQHKIGAGDVKLLFNIVPEAAKYVADRDIESIAKSTVFNNRPDALCVSGLTAGAETDAQLLKRVNRTLGKLLKHRAHHGAILSASDHLSGNAITEKQIDAIYDHRFARARFSGQDRKSLPKINVGGSNDCNVFDM